MGTALTAASSTALMPTFSNSALLTGRRLASPSTGSWRRPKSAFMASMSEFSLSVISLTCSTVAAFLSAASAPSAHDLKLASSLISKPIFVNLPVRAVVRAYAT